MESNSRNTSRANSPEPASNNALGGPRPPYINYLSNPFQPSPPPGVSYGPYPSYNQHSALANHPLAPNPIGQSKPGLAHQLLNLKRPYPSGLLSNSPASVDSLAQQHAYIDQQRNPQHASSSNKRPRHHSSTRSSTSPSGDEDEDDDSEEEEDSEDVAPPSRPAPPAPSAAAFKPSLPPPSQPPPKALIKAKAGPKAGGSSANAGPKPGEVGEDGKKVKATRGSRACTVCRKLKMKCLLPDDGSPPCKRCKNGGHDCVFEESNRGKKSSKKHEAMALSLQKMEQTLNTVLASIHNPALAAASSGMLTRSPSPLSENPTQAEIDAHRLRHALPHSNQINLLYPHPSSLPGTPEPTGSMPSFPPRPASHSQQLYDALLARDQGSRGGTASPAGGRLNSIGNMPPPQQVPLHQPQASRLHSHPNFQSNNASSQSSLPTFARTGSFPPHPPPHHQHPHTFNPQQLLRPHPSSVPASFHNRAHPAQTIITRPSSPRLHSLPDNSLNPLGLLAEASLHNHKRAEARGASSASSSAGSSVLGVKVESAGGRQEGVGSNLNGSGAEDKGKGEGGEGSQEVNQKDGDEEPAEVGVAATAYFKPGPMTMLPLRRIIIERSVRAEILDFLTQDEVTELFDIFFDRINVQIPILDRSFHTPALVAGRSPFLLTAICSIAAKFHAKRSELSAKLNPVAKKLAFEVPSLGFKSVEIVQAYLLLTSYGMPVERFEQDRTWLLLGMGIRVATDLNLQRKSALSGKDTEEGQARDREIINRERTWIMCYILDRSLSAQMGKPYTIREDHIIRSAPTWHNASAFASLPSDRGMTTYACLQQILSRSLDFLYSGTTTASGLHSDIDYPLVLRSVEGQLNVWDDSWRTAWRAMMDSADEESLKSSLEYTGAIGQLYHAYALLMINSFGLQNALERSHLDVGHFFTKVCSAAMSVVAVARDVLAPSGQLRYAPDSTFVMLSYAILSLLKLLRPELTPYQDSPSRIFELAVQAVKVLEDIAISPTHTPALYSRLLRSLLSPISAESTPVTRAPSPTPRDATVDPNAAMAGGNPTTLPNMKPNPTLSINSASANGMGNSSGPSSANWNSPFQQGQGSASSFADQFSTAAFGDGLGGWGGEGGMFGGEADTNGAGGGEDDFGFFPMGESLFDSMLLPGFTSTMELGGGTVMLPGGRSGAITPWGGLSPEARHSHLP